MRTVSYKSHYSNAVYIAVSEAVLPLLLLACCCVLVHICWCVCCARCVARTACAPAGLAKGESVQEQADFLGR